MPDQSTPVPPFSVKRRAQTLHLKYGDLASEYAKVRSETADDAGEQTDVAYWGEVTNSLEQGAERERN